MLSWSGLTHPYVTRGRRAPQQLMMNQDHFDFVHFRGVAHGNLIPPKTCVLGPDQVFVGIAKWPKVLKEANRCMTPGAWVELSETDSELHFPSPSPELTPFKHYSAPTMAP
jgi:hypothetical protein